MKKNLHKLLFVALLIFSSAIYSQITVEVENGTIAGGNATTALLGSENGGTNNVLTNVRKNSGAENTITNSVTIPSAGNYDFTLTYYKAGASGSANDNTLQFSGSGFTTFTHELAKNASPDGSATTTAYGTVTISGIAMTAGTYDIELRAKDPKGFNIDNYIISETPASPIMTSTKTGDWDDPTVWAVSGAVATTPSTTPTAEYDVIIGAHVVTIPSSMGAAAAKSITCTADQGGQLILRQNNTLTVTEDISFAKSNDGMILYAQNGNFSTVTFGGTYLSGKKTTIIRRLSSDKWHLIANPFLNPRVDHTTEHSSSQLRDNGTVLSLASYDTSADSYTYYTNVTPLTSGPKFGTAQGYSISVSHASTPDFVLQGNQHNGAVSYTLSTGGNGFNLLGNPYLSHLNANDAADGTNNILRVNGVNGSNILAEDTIWLWDGDNEVWITKNLGDASFRIAPLQGFFVKASSASAFSFTKSMESHVETDAFLKTTNQRFEVDLILATDKKSTSTSIRYIDNMTTDFDNGYDSSMFGGYASELEVYTGLVQGNLTKKLAIQSLPASDYENMIVPIGVTVKANSEITFTVDTKNIPSGYKIFLEDRLNNTFKRLDEANAKYVATVKGAVTEGRFYLHTRSSALSTDSELLISVSIYKSNASTLRIVGLSQGKANISLYNVLGKQVLSTSFNTIGVKEISLPKLSKGVYIVQLETETGKLNKKIVIE